MNNYVMVYKGRKFCVVEPFDITSYMMFTTLITHSDYVCSYHTLGTSNTFKNRYSSTNESLHVYDVLPETFLYVPSKGVGDNLFSKIPEYLVKTSRKVNYIEMEKRFFDRNTVLDFLIKG